MMEHAVARSRSCWRARPSRRSLLAGALATAALPNSSGLLAAARAGEAGAVPAGGVNLAGADFGKLLGTHGREYAYPGSKHVDYYRGLGFTLIRLPFKWERLQPELNAPFASGEATLLTNITRYAIGSGLQVILDPHNYAKRRIALDGWSREHLIGSDAVPIDSFADFWSRLAAMFKDDSRVLFGLMNEPVGLAAEAWLGIVNRAIAAIRGTQARNLILVPGVAYTGAHSWVRAGNAVLAGVRDPLQNFAFDVHQYVDRDSSGTHPEVVSGTIGSERIEAFQNWARGHGFKAVLGEFNAGRNPAGYNALHDLCQEMSANPDVWLGWAAWAGGPRWPDNEMFNLEPWRDGRVREQTAILAHYARPSSSAFWVAPGAVIDLDFARDRLFGAESFAAVLALADILPPPTGKTDGASAPAGIPRTRKGLRFAASAPAPAIEPQPVGGAVVAIGPLLALLQRPAFTLVVEIRSLTPEPRSCAILSADGRPLLQRTPDGALECLVDARLRTAAQPLAHWRGKRRVAISLRRQENRVAIGATGASAVQGLAGASDLERVVIGGAGGAVPESYFTRITGYPDFLDGDALDSLLA
jgi:endoglucanase